MIHVSMYASHVLSIQARVCKIRNNGISENYILNLVLSFLLYHPIASSSDSRIPEQYSG